MTMARTLGLGPPEWGPPSHCHYWYFVVYEASVVRNLCHMSRKRHGDAVDLSLDGLGTIYSWLQRILEQNELANLLVSGSCGSDSSSRDCCDHYVPNNLRYTCNQALADSIWFYMLVHHE